MKIRGWQLRSSMAVAALFLATQAACDSVVDPGNHPEGIVLVRSDGSEAARYEYSQAVTGSLHVSVNGSTTYRVRVLTESGEVVDLDGEEYSIGDPRAVNTVLVGVTLQGDDEIVLSGLVSGGTTIFFPLMHGGHTEFNVSDIPVVIQPAG